MRAQPSVRKASGTAARAFGPLPEIAARFPQTPTALSSGEPLPLAGFQTFGDTLRSGTRRIHETTIERQDASAIHRLTPRRSCEDHRDRARTREQAHSARLR